MKRMILLSLVLLLLLITTGAQAKQVFIEELDYTEDSFVVVEGNLNLSFNWSENNNANDVQILKIFYDSTFNLTLLRIESKVITFDFAFINNTKQYHYTTTNSTNDYVIAVNYSSITVPNSPIKDLRKMLKEKNQTLNNTLLQLDNLSGNFSEAMNVIDTISNDNDDLETNNQNLRSEIKTLQNFKDDAENIIRDYVILQNTSNNKSIEIAVLKGDINKHQQKAREKNKTIQDLENPFCLTYSKPDPYGGTLSVIHVNFAWLAIGGLVVLIAIYIYGRKFGMGDFGGSTKTLLEKTNGKTANFLSSIRGEKKEEKKDSVDWNEDVPDIEKDILKPPKEKPKEETPEEPKEEEPKPPKEESVEDQVDKLLDAQARQELDRMFG